MKKVLALLLTAVLLLSGCSRERIPEAECEEPPVGEQYAIAFAQLQIVNVSDDGIKAIVKGVSADTNYLAVGDKVVLNIPLGMVQDRVGDLHLIDWHSWIKGRWVEADGCIYDVTYNVLHADNAVWKGENQ